MKRIRIEKVRVRRGPRWLEVLPLDPRDVEVLRAKAIQHAGTQRARASTVGTVCRPRGAQSADREGWVAQAG
jgi:hypothetical protein